MKRFFYFLSFTFFGLCSIGCPAFEITETSAYVAALSGAAAARPLGLMNANLNPAGLAAISQIETTSFYSQIFSIRELTVYGFSAGVPTRKIGALGITTRWFGNRVYAEQEFGIVHGFYLTPHILIGCRLKELGLKISGYGNRMEFGADIGLITEMVKNLHVGIAVRNINRPKITKGADSLPKEYHAGIAYSPVKGLWWMCDFKESSSRPLSFNTGTEFRISPHFSIRGGFQKIPVHFSGGFGLSLHRFQLDYAYRAHETLPSTHQFNITFKFNRS